MQYFAYILYSDDITVGKQKLIVDNVFILLRTAYCFISGANFFTDISGPLINETRKLSKCQI